METWREVFRRGIAPHLSTQGLVALRDALASDDTRLLQGTTTSPPPLTCTQDWAPEGACAIGYCGWQGDNLETVGDVELMFARVCFDADQELEPAACRHFLCWYDETPRPEMIAALLPEVERAIAERADRWGGAASGGRSATSAGSTDRGAQNKTLPPQRGEPCGQGGLHGRDSTADGTPAPSVKAS